MTLLTLPPPFDGDAMGLIERPATPPKLIPGAYLSRGAALYRVDRISPTQVILEDVYRSHDGKSVTRATTASDVLANFVLIVPSNPV
jgi:hypothetical protein